MRTHLSSLTSLVSSVVPKLTTLKLPLIWGVHNLMYLPADATAMKMKYKAVPVLDGLIICPLVYRAEGPVFVSR